MYVCPYTQYGLQNIVLNNFKDTFACTNVASTVLFWTTSLQPSSSGGRTNLSVQVYTRQQLVGEGPYCLHMPFSEQAQRTLLNLPTQEKVPIIKSETRTNKLAAAVHQDLPRRTAVKWPSETGL